METPPSRHVRISLVVLPLFLFYSVAGFAKHTECKSAEACDDSSAEFGDDHISLLQRRALTGRKAVSEQTAADHHSDISDPFDEVPSELVWDAVRVGFDFKRMASPRNTTEPRSALIDEARRVKSAHTWDVAAVKSALTSVQCQGAERKRSCAFTNLYFNYAEGGFFVFSLEGTAHPDFESVLLLHKWSQKGEIKQKTFSSLADFRAFLGEHDPLVHEGLSLIYDSVWHQNIGHAIWDGLYPAFSALCEWGREDEKFRSVVGFAEKCNQHSKDNGKCMSEGVFQRFGGVELVPYHSGPQSSDLQGTGWHRFDDAIAGSGRKGQRSLARDYSLPGSRDNDRVRKFRDRMYTSHGLEVPHAHNLVDAKERSLPLQGIIIQNKRFAPSEKELLRHIASDASESEKVQLQYIDFSKEPFHGSFRTQLELIGKTAIHVSGPGTAQCYEPFLPDGSVHINLGDRRKLPGDGIRSGLPGDRSVSFMEEVWSEGIPYVRALHYDPYLKAPVDLDKTHLMDLIRQAGDLIQARFPVPVPKGENLSPIARVFTEYCKAIGPDCDDLIGLLNGDQRTGFATNAPDVGWCNVNGWAETVVFEIGGWSESGQVEDGFNVRCGIDHELLRQIRKRHLGW